MKDLKIRVISAVIFFLLFIVASVNPLLFALVFSTFTALALYELKQFAARKNVKLNNLFLLYGYLFFWFVFFVYYANLDTLWILPIIAVLFLIVVLDLLRDKFVLNKFLFYGFGFLYVVLSMSMMNFLVLYDEEFSIKLFWFFFLIIWTNDIAAYFVGSALGKRKLAPKISPKKTIEGTLGGVFFSVIVALVYNKFLQVFDYFDIIFLALGISIFGVLGDLVESSFKRELDLKDSGKIMPGHGGILDRLDSSIFAIWFVVSYLIIKSLL